MARDCFSQPAKEKMASAAKMNFAECEQIILSENLIRTFFSKNFSCLRHVAKLDDIGEGLYKRKMFNAAQIHLALNHAPVMIVFVGIGVLAAGIYLRSVIVQRVAFSLIVVGALSTLPVYFTGQPAEQVAKNYPGVSRLLIHDHQESAEFSAIAVAVVGALNLALLWLSIKRALPKFAPTMVLILTLVSAVLLARTAHLGGKIRHEEVRNDDRF